MNTFYSILYCPIRSISDERISIALLLRYNSKVFFKFSHDKLKIIKELIPDPSYRLLKANLKNIESYFENESNNEILEKSLFSGLIPVDEQLPNFVNAQYINYLSVYSNNLIQFSKPHLLSIEINNEVFNKLYQKFIFEFDEIVETGTNIYQKVRKKLNPSLKNHVNIDIQLTSTEINNLVVPTKVWFIGQNEIDVTGEIFDFSKSTYFLETEVTKHLNLIHTLNEFTSHRGTHFIVGIEPPKRLKKNHYIWNNFRNLKNIKYTPTSDLSAINEYIEEHNVSPFLPLNEDDVADLDYNPF